MADIAPEMRLFSPVGERLYLTTDKRNRFLKAADEKERKTGHRKGLKAGIWS